MSVRTPEFPVRDLLGVPVHAASFRDVLDACGRAVRSRERLGIAMVNVAKLVNMRRDPLLRRAVVGRDLVLADGMAVVWASRLLGEPLPERVAGIDLFQELLSLAEREGFSVYVLGARTAVLEQALERIRREHPELRIVGSRDGYFRDEEQQDVAEAIRQAQPDLLFVAISSPRKEMFLERWADAMDVPVTHGIGGSIDVLAGVARRAPELWQRTGFEWLYRLLQEPRRMWRRYLVTNTVFIAWLVAALLRRGGRALSGRR